MTRAVLSLKMNGATPADGAVAPIDERKFFELPDGVAATGFFGRVDLKAQPGRNGNLVHVTMKRTMAAGGQHYVFIELDPEMAEIFANHLCAVAKTVESAT